MEAVADNRLKIENLTNVLLEAAQLIVSAAEPFSKADLRDRSCSWISSRRTGG